LFSSMTFQMLFDEERYLKFHLFSVISLLICSFCCSVVVVFVSVLAIRTFVNFCDGNTIIEAKEREQTDKEFPFDLGVWKNLCYFLGRFPFLWPFPQQASFRSYEELMAKTSDWPPNGVFFSAEDKHLIH
jgi:hypothetical protein